MAEFSSDKIRELLSDPKNIELIAGIAGSMGAGGLLGEKNAGRTETPPIPPLAERTQNAGEYPEQTGSYEPAGALVPTESDAALRSPPENALPVSAPGISAAGLAGMLGSAGGTDKRIALLKAIKPYVSDSKKERVDGLVRAISVAGILNNYKGGLFG